MRKMIGAVSAVALLVAASGGLAADEATGTIESYDELSGMLVLDTGEAFEVAEGLQMEGLQEGDEVRVTYEDQDGIWVATSVEAAAEAFEEPAEEEAVD